VIRESVIGVEMAFEKMKTAGTKGR